MGSRTEIYLFSILILQALAIPIFAEENIDDSKSVMLETDKPEYRVGEMMIISGFVEEKKMPVVAIRIFDPNGGILSAHQLELEADNTFSKTILLDSPFYDDEGDYTISVHYGKLQAETNFKMVSVGQDEPLVEDNSLTLFPEIIVMFTDKEVYQDGDTVTIYGLVSEKDEESVLVGIYDPFDTPAGFYFGNVDSNLEFKVSFLAKAGVNFKTDGTYSISAFYGDSEEVVNFEFVKQNKNQTPIEEKKTSDDIKSSTLNKKITEDKNDVPALPNNNVKNPVTTPSKNLSVEDIELGLMLNQINLKCDRNEFVDTISYYDGMGPALIRLCRYSDAIFYYDQSLLKEPNNVDILTNKGSALAKMGLYEEAIKYYNLALAVKPTNYFTLNNKANALANLGNFQEAFSLYRKALNVGDNPIVLQNLEKALDKSLALEIKNKQIILKNDTQSQDSIMESEKNLVKTSNQQTENIFDQLGSILSSIGNSLFSFFS
ncbi:MAG: tetratricopeptide repeat protein [Nitrosopumilaceae archaeon]